MLIFRYMTNENNPLSELLDRAKSRLDSTKSANIFTQGCIQASKDSMSSYPAYLVKKQEELSELVSQGKMSIETGNAILTYLKGVVNYLDERYRDYEKINHIKQGELISINTYVNELQDALNKFQHVQVQEPIVQEVVEITPGTFEPVQEIVHDPIDVPMKKRPDELNNSVARASRDIKNRRKAALEHMEATRKPGRPKNK